MAYTIKQSQLVIRQFDRCEHLQVNIPCQKGVSDELSQTNSSWEFWIINLRFGFGVLGLSF